MVRSLEWRAANGDVILFCHAAPFLLDTFYPGTAAGMAETVRAIRADGQKTFHVSLEPLTPTMTGSMIALGSNAQETQRNLDNLRRRLQAALNPKHFGTLVFHNNAGSFKLRCRPLTAAAIDRRFAGTHRIDIDWVSDEPYWTSLEEKELSVGLVLKKWRFPWAIAPTVFGAIQSTGIIENPTFIDIYPKIVISATESENVTVGNASTGDFVIVNHSIRTGQKLELDMSVPLVTLIHEDGTREDVTHWTTLDSVFPWAVVPGMNEIYSKVDDPELSPFITLSWHQPEGGI